MRKLVNHKDAPSDYPNKVFKLIAANLVVAAMLKQYPRTWFTIAAVYLELIRGEHTHRVIPTATMLRIASNYGDQIKYTSDYAFNCSLLSQELIIFKAARVVYQAATFLHKLSTDFKITKLKLTDINIYLVLDYISTFLSATYKIIRLFFLCAGLSVSSYRVMGIIYPTEVLIRIYLLSSQLKSPGDFNSTLLFNGSLLLLEFITESSGLYLPAYEKLLYALTYTILPTKLIYEKYGHQLTFLYKSNNSSKPSGKSDVKNTPSLRFS
jgi:hypothetical protein